MKNSKRILASLIIAGLCACSKPDAASTPSGTAVTASGSTQPISHAETAVSRAEPLNAAPLGVEVGYANLEGVKAKFSGVTKLENDGINKYSGGPMLSSNGDGVGLDGLSNLTFIFDKDNVLAAVLMTLPKNPTDVFAKLSGKYQVVDNKIDKFMNYGNAKLEKGETVVVIEALHLSFDMSVRYLTKQLSAEFMRQSESDEKQKRQDQTNKL